MKDPKSRVAWDFNWIEDCSILWLEISQSLHDSRYNNTRVLGDLFVFTAGDPLIPNLWPSFTTQLSLVPLGPPMVVNDPFYCIKYYLLCYGITVSHTGGRLLPQLELCSQLPSKPSSALIITGLPSVIFIKTRPRWQHVLRSGLSHPGTEVQFSTLLKRFTH